MGYAGRTADARKPDIVAVRNFGGCIENRFVPMFEIDVNKPGEGGIVELLTFGNLCGIHAGIVVSHDLSDDRVLRLCRCKMTVPCRLFRPARPATCSIIGMPVRGL